MEKFAPGFKQKLQGKMSNILERAVIEALQVKYAICSQALCLGVFGVRLKVNTVVSHLSIRDFRHVRFRKMILVTYIELNHKEFSYYNYNKLNCMNACLWLNLQ